jgi:DNA-binding MarR family transcriptional regulator
VDTNDDTPIPSRPLPALLSELEQAAIAELHERLGEEGHPGIRPAHGCVFRFIDAPGSRLTELAERAGLTKQAVGEVVDNLEQLGYVERVPDPEDGRAKTIRLTASGREARQAAARVFAEIERGWAERVGEERMALVRETLEQLVAVSGAERAVA